MWFDCGRGRNGLQKFGGFVKTIDGNRWHAMHGQLPAVSPAVYFQEGDAVLSDLPDYESMAVFAELGWPNIVPVASPVPVAVAPGAAKPPAKVP